jgi:cell division protein FtsX
MNLNVNVYVTSEEDDLQKTVYKILKKIDKITEVEILESVTEVEILESDLVDYAISKKKKK